ncbi:MAG: hypothetical protein FWG65_10980 [Turicibacter sp.]|nr:hypothetical protein [Turicibacter sp.]
MKKLTKLILVATLVVALFVPTVVMAVTGDAPFFRPHEINASVPALEMTLDFQFEDGLRYAEISSLNHQEICECDVPDAIITIETIYQNGTVPIGILEVATCQICGLLIPYERW